MSAWWLAGEPPGMTLDELDEMDEQAQRRQEARDARDEARIEAQLEAPDSW